MILYIYIPASRQNFVIIITETITQQSVFVECPSFWYCSGFGLYALCCFICAEGNFWPEIFIFSLSVNRNDLLDLRPFEPGLLSWITSRMGLPGLSESPSFSSWFGIPGRMLYITKLVRIQHIEYFGMLRSHFKFSNISADLVSWKVIGNAPS